jgi:acyl-CoA thioester hydrolase, YbgC/YbaW family
MSEAIKCEDLEFKIYVEDTDFQGFVYYANYLKFFERARSKFLDDNQISQKKLKELNHTFIVKNVNIEYLKPAELGDQIIVQSKVEKKSDARMIFYQSAINFDNKEYVKGMVEVCFIDLLTKKPQKVPQMIYYLIF